MEGDARSPVAGVSSRLVHLPEPAKALERLTISDVQVLVTGELVWCKYVLYRHVFRVYHPILLQFVLLCG